MPVKNTLVKKSKGKESSSKVVAKSTNQKAEIKDDEEAEIAPTISSKIKAPIEIDEAEVVSPLDEKPETDPLSPEEDADETAVEESILEEEIDPFGDKWEA